MENAANPAYASPNSVRAVADDLSTAANLLYNRRKKYTVSGKKPPMFTYEAELKALGLENAELKNGARHVKSGGLLCETPEVKCRFIFEYPEFPKAKWAAQMNLSRSGYYHWKRTRDKARLKVFACIEGFFNTSRAQKRLGYLSPMQWLMCWNQGRQS